MTMEQKFPCAGQGDGICYGQSPGSNSRSLLSEESDRNKIKAASAPVGPIDSAEELTKQISAPAYLHSLKDNVAPPFVLQRPDPVPRLKIKELFNEDDVIRMIACADEDKVQGLKLFLGQFLVEREVICNYELSEKNFLISLLTEVVDYGAHRDFNPFKLSVMLTLYIDAHRFFKWYYWQSPTNLWNYFKEMMIRHTIEDSPTGQEVFEPQECYNILTHFHTMYLSNLPLIHIITFGSYRLKLEWPFNAK